MIDKFIDLLVEWIVKSDTRFLIENIKNKNEDWLRKWLEARKFVLTTKGAGKRFWIKEWLDGK